MFKKNDALVDSVKSVMETSDLDRQIEAAVNEQFGISSKNGLPHELRTAYEEAITEMKKCATEELKGNQHNIDVANKKGEPKPDGQLSSHDFKLLRKKAVEESWKLSDVGTAGKGLKQFAGFSADHDFSQKAERGYNKGREGQFSSTANVDTSKIGKGGFTGHETSKMGSMANINTQGSGGFTASPKTASTPKSTYKPKTQVKSSSSPEDPAGSLSRKVKKDMGVNEDLQLDEKAKATAAQQSKVAKVMHDWKAGKQHIGKSEKTVPVSEKGQKQAVAIGLKMAGLSRKGKQMEEEALFEEIRTNLEEQLVYAYENLSEEDFETYVNSLTEEQLQILGLDEGAISDFVTKDIPGWASRATAYGKEKAGDISKAVQSGIGSLYKGAAGMTKDAAPMASKSLEKTGQSWNKSGEASEKSWTASANKTLASAEKAGTIPKLDKYKTDAGQTPTAPSQTASVARRSSAPTSRPAVKPAAKQKMYGAASAGDVNSSLSGSQAMREETKPQIKESFEQFLRNKFLKG